MKYVIQGPAPPLSYVRQRRGGGGVGKPERHILQKLPEMPHTCYRRHLSRSPLVQPSRGQSTGIQLAALTGVGLRALLASHWAAM